MFLRAESRMRQQSLAELELCDATVFWIVAAKLTVEVEQTIRKNIFLNI